MNLRRSKLNFLIGASLKRKIKTKWFLIAQIVLLVLICAMINLESIIGLFGGDFNKPTKLYIVDETDISADTLTEAIKLNTNNLYGEDNESYDIIISDKTLDETRDIVNEDGGIIINVIPSDDNIIKANLISKTTIDTYDYGIIYNSLNNLKTLLTLDELGITGDDYNKLNKEIEVNREVIDSNATTEEENTEMIVTTVFPIFILPFFVLSIILIQMIGAEVNDEKTTKAMEIIISNVSPTTHFTAKIIAGNLFVIAQAILLVIYAVIALGLHHILGDVTTIHALSDTVVNTIRTVTTGELGDKLIYILPLTLILMFLTFIAYSLVAGILASMTTTTEDFQQVQTPIVIISLLGYYLAMMASMFKGALFIKILAFVPFISAILAPSLLVLGQINIVGIIGSILIMIITILLMMKYGIKIYKAGLLNYSGTGLWKKMFKAIKS